MISPSTETSSPPPEGRIRKEAEGMIQSKTPTQQHPAPGTGSLFVSIKNLNLIRSHIHSVLAAMVVWFDLWFSALQLHSYHARLASGSS